jgi:hypothetical protein
LKLVKFAVKARFRQRMGAFAGDGSELAERRTETRWLPSRTRNG